jgi:hypothetical protein
VAFSKIGGRSFDSKTQYWLSRNEKRIQKKYEKFNEDRKLLIDKFVEKDQSGEYKLTQDKRSFLFGSREQEKAYLKALDDLYKESIKLEIFPIPLETLTAAFDVAESSLGKGIPYEITSKLLFLVQEEEEGNKKGIPAGNC